MNGLSANQAPARPEVPSLPGVARVAGVLRHQASVAGPDAFPGFTADYDPTTQAASFSQTDSKYEWREILVGTNSVTITNVMAAREGTQYTDGVVRIIETYPLAAGGPITYEESHGYVRTDGTLFQEEGKHSERPVNEITYSNLLKTLTSVKRAEPKAPRPQRMGSVATFVGWLLHGSQQPRLH